MKTSFKSDRGHNYHVIHETKTAGARKSAYTLCGEFIERGEASTRQPTCPNCKKLDNPLSLTLDMINYLNTVATFTPWRDPPKSKAYHALVERDYITPGVALTRRGQVLVEDFELGAVPLADASGIVHARQPLGLSSVCADPVLRGTSSRVEYSITLVGADNMTVSRYEKLRKVHDDVVVTCISCLGK
jgi:hypothetical protein